MLALVKILWQVYVNKTKIGNSLIAVPYFFYDLGVLFCIHTYSSYGKNYGNFYSIFS